MATGRTLQRWARLYVGGYDMSGFTRQIGPMSIDAGAAEVASLTDTVRGVLPGVASINLGNCNVLMDTTGYSLFNGYQGAATVATVALGIRAAPAAGDPTWTGYFQISAHTAETEMNSGVYATLGFGEWNAGYLYNYAKPWGRLLHAYAARTGANSATGAGVNNGAATTAGGLFWYHLLSLDAGTATLSVDDSTDDSTYGALSGATSGALAAANTYGIVALGTTATVKQYLRWQLALAGGASTVTFVCGFNRG